MEQIKWIEENGLVKKKLSFLICTAKSPFNVLQKNILMLLK